MGISNKDDRREHSRVGFTTRIEIILKADGKQVNLDANSKDLSLKGIFVETGEQFPLKTHCEVNIYLSGGVDDIKLEILGCIVRQTEAGIGIVFESMDVDTYTHLKNIVRYNSGDESV
ncbi:MAG: PilZ domain-containing protein [Desulfobacterales bacterium]|nr:PilZ domain-containing protein [Desulfobacterales bacterium]